MGGFHGEVAPRPREPRLPLPDPPLDLEPRSTELLGEGLSSTTGTVTELACRARHADLLRVHR